MLDSKQSEICPLTSPGIVIFVVASTGYLPLSNKYDVCMQGKRYIKSSIFFVFVGGALKQPRATISSNILSLRVTVVGADCLSFSKIVVIQICDDVIAAVIPTPEYT